MPKTNITISMAPEKFREMINALCESIAGESVFEDIKKSQTVLESIETEGPEEVKNILCKIGFDVKEVILKIEHTFEKELEDKPYKRYRMI